MAKKNDNDTVDIGRRSAMLAVGGLGVFGVLATRLYYLQVVEAENYKALSDQNRFNFNIVMPERGRIVDRYGEPIATNKQDFRLVIVPERVKNFDQTLNRISKILPIDQTTRKRIKTDIRKNPKFVPVLVDEHLDWSVFSALSMKLPDIPGAIPLAGQGRDYPHIGIFSHILGYVGKPNEEALENEPDALLRQPSFRMGKTGVEQSMDKVLRGTAGRQKVEVNALGRTVREWDDGKIEAKRGDDVWLTIDTEMQAFTAEQFGEESGGAVIIDVMTGELRTLLSMPTFDNNLWVSGLTSAEMKRLNSDPKRPQYNKVIGGGYPPASTFKMAVMLAALEHKIVKPTDKVFCTGKTRLGNRTFHCWKRRGHGLMDMHDALQNSCDTYFYEIIQRLGMDKVRPIAEALGLGQTFDIGIGGQISGVVPDAEWKSRKLGQAWRMGDSLNAAIGQGFVLATPLQLAVMTARLANVNQAVMPKLIVDGKSNDFAELGINPDHIRFVQEAMYSVCERPGGTAYRYNGLGIAGVKLAGKTGTGQVRGISKEERLSGVLKNQKLPWKLRDHSVFVGFAPYENPRFASAVIVEHGGSGAKLAANITRAILGKALTKDGVLPRDQIRN
ncbi:MAG: penicillin-binding protein 2 [Acidimicrobiales bacterium]|nr:penicillin-binding protein 2 [Hyphomonadaceae bacterium]RZV41624.1 MAG: penicillin-binding protein 2 [Acidimicrobiales bacterium]